MAVLEYLRKDRAQLQTVCKDSDGPGCWCETAAELRAHDSRTVAYDLALAYVMDLHPNVEAERVKDMCNLLRLEPELLVQMAHDRPAEFLSNLSLAGAGLPVVDGVINITVEDCPESLVAEMDRLRQHLIERHRVEVDPAPALLTELASP